MPGGVDGGGLVHVSHEDVTDAVKSSSSDRRALEEWYGCESVQFPAPCLGPLGDASKDTTIWG